MRVAGSTARSSRRGTRAPRTASGRSRWRASKIRWASRRSTACTARRRPSSARSWATTGCAAGGSAERPNGSPTARPTRSSAPTRSTGGSPPGTRRPRRPSSTTAGGRRVCCAGTFGTATIWSTSRSGAAFPRTSQSRPTSDRVKATLIEDGGAAASHPEQFFRSSSFLEAEAVTHTVAIEGGAELRLPVIVREIDGTDLADAISPYGYPGADRTPDDPPRPDQVDWSETGLVSIFVRDRIGERPCLAGGTTRAAVHVADGDGGVRKRLREQIRRNERRGWETRPVPGREVEMGQLRAFERAYSETMSRTDAAERYLYPTSYFGRLLLAERSWLVLAEREEEPLSGAIAVASDGYLHYYLGGTADEALRDSPMKNLFWAMICLGAELGLPVNLGGGLAPGDSLDDFKRGFANTEAPWHTHEVICDREAYDELSAAAAASPEFFPAYRA